MTSGLVLGRAGNVLTALMLTPKLMELHGDQKNNSSFTVAFCISLPQILGRKSRGSRREQLQTAPLLGQALP